MTRRDLPAHQLGRNDAPAPQKPVLAPSKIFPGMQAVQPIEHGIYQSRTGGDRRNT